MTFFRFFRIAASTIAMTCLVALVPDHADAAGYRELKGDGAPVHVWYPTDSAPVAGRLGPFDVEQAGMRRSAPGPTRLC